MLNALWYALVAFQFVVFAYFLVLNTYYLVTSIFAFNALQHYARRLNSFDLQDLITSAGAPPVTVLVPAYNEAETCIDAVLSFLALEYPNHEVLLVNDGSTDDTLEVLQRRFDLVPAPRYPTSTLETAAVRGTYQSQQHPNLWIIDKEQGGKADALNAGINFCRTPYFCPTDADTLLERESLARLIRPFLEDDRTVAAGGIVRIANGCTVRSGVVQDVRLPGNLLARFQVLEYLRSFLAGRVGWDALDILLIVSGAFGMFRRSLIVEAGGYNADSIGEDMELTVRLHRHCREEDIPYRISFVPDPVAWTEGPESMRVLGRQRNRWQRGLIDTLRRHGRMLFNAEYGRVGLVAYPYFFFLEMIGPIIEMLGYAVFLAVVALNIATVPYALAFVLLAVVLGTILSIVSVGLEEISFRRYARFGDLMRLFGLALVENLGYRQILVFHRFQGTLAYLLGDTRWGSMTRKGFERESD